MYREKCHVCGTFYTLFTHIESSKCFSCNIKEWVQLSKPRYTKEQIIALLKRERRL